MNRFVTYGLGALFLILSFVLTNCDGNIINNANNKDHPELDGADYIGVDYNRFRYNGLNLRFEESKKVTAARAKNRRLWNRFYDQVYLGHPKEAVVILERLYHQSLRLKLADEAARAKALQCLLSGYSTKDDGIDKSIIMLKNDILLMDASLRPLMYLLLGRWYFTNFNIVNDKEEIDRHFVTDFDRKAFKVRDVKKIFTKIDDCYDRAFKDEELLKKMMLSQYQGLFWMGNAPANLRPTVFDFAVYDALEFYKSKDNLLVKPYDDFEMDALSPALADAAQFIAYEPEVTDKSSRRYKALKLYRKLLEFHRHDEEPDAFIDADISRLNFVYDNSVCKDEVQKREIYMKRLEAIIKKYPASEVTALAYYYCAKAYWQGGDGVKAVALIDAAKKTYPESKGTALCFELEEPIKKKKLKIIAGEMAIPGKENKITVESRNIDSLTLAIYKRDKTYRQGDLLEGRGILRGSPKIQPVKKITFPLNVKGGYRTCKNELSLPALKPGFYTVIVSCAEDFREDENIMDSFFINVSGLALLTREINEGWEETFVIDGESGRPVAGAKVEAYKSGDGTDKIQSLKTGVNGVFNMIPPAGETFIDAELLVVSDGKGSETFDHSRYYRNYGYKLHEKDLSVVFFTGCSSYRPGETVFFKAVALSYDYDCGIYSVLPSQKLEIVLSDVDDKAINWLELTSDKFGLVTGSFKLPADCSPGNMKLSCSSMTGSCFFKLAEYRRPQFFVKLERPGTQPRLGDKVTISGNVVDNSGAAVEGAKIVCRVTRAVTLPPWSNHHILPETQSSWQEITGGSITADEKGRFSFSFTALPDFNVDKSLQPLFDYKVSVDVTDSSGATISGDLTVRLGYCEVLSSISCDDWQTDRDSVKIKVSASTVAGHPVATCGKIRLVSLKQPLLPFFDDGLLMKCQLDNWPVMAVIEERDVKTSENGSCAVAFNLRSGVYRAEFVCRDNHGEKISSYVSFIVIDENSKRSAACLPSYFISEKTSLAVGDTFKGVWGSGYQSGTAYVQILKDGKTLTSYWTPYGQTQVPVTVPITKELCGGFTVAVFTVKENRFYSHIRKIDVPRDDKNFEVTVESLRSKLITEDKSAYIIKIKDSQGGSIPLGFAAALYAHSLYFRIPYLRDYPTFDIFFCRDNTSISSRFNVRPAEIRNLVDSFHMPFFHVANSSFRSYFGAPQGGDLWQPWESYPSWSYDLGTDPFSPHLGFVVYYAYDGCKESLRFAPMKDPREEDFFYPNLALAKDEEFTIKFKKPDSEEALTFITHKELTVETDAPHLLRQGDVFEFTVKATNLTSEEIVADINIDFFEPASGKKINAKLRHNPAAKTVNLPGMQARTVSWSVKIPGGLQNIAYRSSVKSSVWIDSEEDELPVAAVKK